MIDFDVLNSQFDTMQPVLEQNFGMSSDVFGSFAEGYSQEHMFDDKQPSMQSVYKSAIDFNYADQRARADFSQQIRNTMRHNLEEDRRRQIEAQKEQERIAREERLADIASAKMTSDAFRDLGRSLDSFGRTGVGFLG